MLRSRRLGTPYMLVFVRELNQNAQIILSEVRKRLFCMIFSSSLVEDDSIQ